MESDGMIIFDLDAEPRTVTDSEEKIAEIAASIPDYYGSVFPKLMESGVLSDITLHVGRKGIAAHKMVLRLDSEVFQGMIYVNTLKGQGSYLELTDIDLPVAKLLMKWMYARRLEKMSTQDAIKLYIAADKYKIMALKAKCCSYLSDNMCREYAEEVSELSKMYGDENLAKAAADCLAGNATCIVEADEFSAKKP